MPAGASEDFFLFLRGRNRLIIIIIIIRYFNKSWCPSCRPINSVRALKEKNQDNDSRGNLVTAFYF